MVAKPENQSTSPAPAKPLNDQVTHDKFWDMFQMLALHYHQAITLANQNETSAITRVLYFTRLSLLELVWIKSE